MARMIFVNLPVEDVARATTFYQAIGFEKNEQFSNEAVSAMNWSETIHVMLMSRGFMATFTDKTIVDPKTSVSAIHALSLEDRAEVDRFTEAALSAGGRELHEPEDMGFMYSRGFEDPDGNGWGPFAMDVAAHVAAMAEGA